MHNDAWLFAASSGVPTTTHACLLHTLQEDAEAAAKKGKSKVREPLAEIAQSNEPESSIMAEEGQGAPDEPVSDTDDEAEGGWLKPKIYPVIMQ